MSTWAELIHASTFEPLEPDEGFYHDFQEVDWNEFYREIDPSDENYLGTIFIDQSRVDRDFTVENVIAHYQEKYPDPARQFVLHAIDPEALRFFTLSDWTAAEREFNQRGYVAPIAFRYAGRGNQIVSRFVREHYRTLDSSSAIFGRMLEAIGPKMFGWAEKFATDGLPEGDRTWFIEGKVLKCVGQMSGCQSLRGGLSPSLSRQVKQELIGEQNTKRLIAEKQRVYREHLRRPHKYDLIRREGLFLATLDAGPDDEIHFAQTFTPMTLLKRNRSDNSHMPLFGKNADRVLDQVSFEISPEASASLFNARYCRDAPNEVRPATPVTSDMILVWQSQVLAILRKATWRAALDEVPSVAADNLRLEAERLPLEGRRLQAPFGSRGVPRGRPAPNLAERIYQMADAYAETLSDDNQVIGSEQIVSELTEEEFLTACLHGATFSMAEADSPPDSAELVAFWIGRLKREGKGLIDGSISIALFDIHNQIWNSFFIDLLAQPVWSAIFEAAQRVIRTSDVVNVTYNWSRDVENPWSSDVNENGHLIIHGPLLSFPLSKAEIWAERTGIVRENQDFVV
ncbi:hypothetical protein U0C82_18315 [Fulvimarina sp. 2208YS6-2-32]|uniref:Uncharacterized protein n=1 Tax=Fulvimarina uroteuthidis TaxID=3098149 RepID=A0ABU5I9Z6_9HYPH|nr:hypothetical protein [Fulvimarina sp. 2208YS6-2-32]MDY8111081.1 hypothetical protein [Fulvimarina sp. 2208YS6-2-32]